MYYISKTPVIKVKSVNFFTNKVIFNVVFNNYRYIEQIVNVT